MSTRGTAGSSAARRPLRSRVTATQWVVVSMLVGVALGHAFPDAPGATGFRASDLAVVSTIFLRMIKSLIVPLLFSTLVVGIAGHGDDLKNVGTLALRSMVYFEVVTTLALGVGLVAVNVVRPGLGVHLGAATADVAANLAQTRATLSGILEHVVPQSLFEAAAKNDALQITFFAVIFAVALSRVEGRAKSFMLALCESLSQVTFRFVAIVMKFAPFGIGAAIAVTVGRSGVGVMKSLSLLVFTLYGTLVMFVVAVLVPIAAAGKVPLRRFARAVREPWLVAFTTASSEAAFPIALENMVELGVPRRIVSFVLPTGYAFNMDGTTLYLAIASVFVAQAAGVQMPLSQQLLMMLTLMLTSKGLAAVPRTSLVVLSATMVQFGLPLQGVAVILGVDAFMDMARTSVNVIGNCLASVLLARWEGSFGGSSGEETASAAAPVLRAAVHG